LVGKGCLRTDTGSDLRYVIVAKLFPGIRGVGLGSGVGAQPGAKGMADRNAPMCSNLARDLWKLDLERLFGYDSVGAIAVAINYCAIWHYTSLGCNGEG